MQMPSINVSNAITLGLQQRLHLHGNQINIALALFYVPYILAEIPSNLLLKRLRPQFWRMHNHTIVLKGSC